MVFPFWIRSLWVWIPISIALNFASAEEKRTTGLVGIDVFLEVASYNDAESIRALTQIGGNWNDSYVPLLVDLTRFLFPPRNSMADPEFPQVHPARARVAQLLKNKTRKSYSDDFKRWRVWMWSMPYNAHPDYLNFKRILYGRVDKRMSLFFQSTKAEIRLDEIDWGGVQVNGIPPLRYPKTFKADETEYLKNSNVVFGIVVNGEARAYPKRILAWHEMAIDKLGKLELTIVYCTLCGTVIPYESVVGGKKRTFGTSGLLYRSNKLMFDHNTQSLWSTLEGRPVAGPLTGSGLELKARPVVTTTWGEWKELHPNTTVLSLDTGHKRNYREGVAYRSYFSTQNILFEVPEKDRRLKNKAEILGIQFTTSEDKRAVLAISADFLSRNRIYQMEFQGRSLLVLTSEKGANRAYFAGTQRFVRSDGLRTAVDDKGNKWRVTEEALVPEDPGKRVIAALPRISAYRAFWFGWCAQFPDTELVK
jgi:hypothetical protein